MIIATINHRREKSAVQVAVALMTRYKKRMITKAIILISLGRLTKITDLEGAVLICQDSNLVLIILLRSRDLVHLCHEQADFLEDQLVQEEAVQIIAI